MTQKHFARGIWHFENTQIPCEDLRSRILIFLVKPLASLGH